MKIKANKENIEKTAQEITRIFNVDIEEARELIKECIDVFENAVEEEDAKEAYDRAMRGI